MGMAAGQSGVGLLHPHCQLSYAKTMWNNEVNHSIASFPRLRKSGCPCPSAPKVQIQTKAPYSDFVPRDGSCEDNRVNISQIST